MDTTPTSLPAMPPAPPPDAHPRLHALHAHFSAIWQKVADVAHVVVSDFERAAGVIKADAPIVEAAAAAVAAAVPAAGPVAQVVEKVAVGAVAGVNSLADLLEKTQAAAKPPGA